MNMVAAILSISTSNQDDETDDDKDLLFNDESNDDQGLMVTEDGWSDDEYAVMKAYYENEEEEDWLEIRKALGIVEDLDPRSQFNDEQKTTVEDIKLTPKKIRL
ncbi:unnamed protein product [Cunninghamella echinulata]